jgi:eukaryotic-like serine/threonine-protein kinase
VTTVALGLAAAAWVARNDAERRQAQAEDILGFMLGDLRKKLTTVGRLDLMRAVDDKAIRYFATLDPRDLSDRALEEQARALTGIGEVRISEGNHDDALAAFREAHARSTMLHEREPANGQRLFDLAQAEYWLGFVALEQGRHEDQRRQFPQ